MNRSLRSTLNKHLRRAFAGLTLTLISVLSYGQISNCPTGFVNLNVDDSTNCTADFSVTPAITASMAATFTISGATEVMTPLTFDMLESFPFEFGVSEVTIVDGMESCVFTVVNTIATPPFSDLCDDITIDLGGECIAQYTLPPSFDQTGTASCEAGTITFSFDNTDPSSNIFTADANNLGDLPVQVFITKGADQGSCTKTITVVDSDPIIIALECPTDKVFDVAPSCQYVYAFQVNATVPCGGVTMQSAGPPSNSPLAAGQTTYQFEVLDIEGTQGSLTCVWVVSVSESLESGAQVNCLANVNISVDQTCEAIVTPFTFVTGQICGDLSLYSVYATLPSGEEIGGSSITFTQDQVGQDINVTVFDPNGFNSCWSTVTIEDKIAPIISCPSDVTITCLQSADTSMTGVPVLLTSLRDDTQQTATISNGSCEVELFYSDFIEDFQCDGPYQRIITRTFYVVDNAGNRSDNCVQQIFVTRETLASTEFPEHYDGIDGPHPGLNDNGVGSNPPLACDGQDTEWASIMKEDGTIVPSPFDSITPSGDTIPGTGSPGGIGTCGTIFSFFEDIVIEICNEECSNFNPSFKVLRSWDIFDWCTGEMLIHEQIIKVIDSVPPVFTVGVPDLTVSTDLWGCGATIDLPEVVAVDQCATDISYSWYIVNGTYDAVLNKVYIPDNALTEEGGEIELVAFAEDCCGNIVSDTGYVTIIDLIPPVAVADEHTVVSLNNQAGDGSTKVHVDSFDDGSWDNCGPIDWWVRRMDVACENYDGLDSLGNIDPSEPDEVNDFHKYLHFCCEDVDSLQRVVFMVCDDGDQDGIVEMNGDDNCTTSMIIVDVQDKLAPTVVCPNPVTINCIDFATYEDYVGAELTEDQVNTLNVRFGEATTTSTCVIVGDQAFDGEEFCGGGTAFRTFEVMNSNGTASCIQTIFIEAEKENTLTCDRITFPTLSLSPYNYNWCDPSDEVAPFVTPVTVDGCGGVSIEEPVIDRDNLCTQTGVTLTLDTFNFANGGCIKILAHWEIIDQCIFDENYLDDADNEINPFVSENGYFEIYIEYDIFDTDSPVLECEDQLVETADCELNFGSFSISASDECTPADALGYAYKVDFNADGTYDFPADSSYANGSSFDANLVGGLPLGTHNIKWVVNDGCGNYGVCLQEIEVVQRIKAPTPYCYLGLSSAVMDSVFGCSVEIWALDFIPEEGVGACGDELTYLMIPYQDIYGDPADEDDDLSVEDALEMATPGWEFGCEYIENGVQHVIEIRIYAVDENGVFDFCDASLTLNDNFDCCTDEEFGTPLVAGHVMTEKKILMKDVELIIEGKGPEMPKIAFTSENGSYIFNGLKYDEDYTVSAFYDHNALAGVSTLDLVLIQRHILGMTQLNSPYKLIAADVNNNETISAADLLQLRKLILGLYPDDKFPNNKSWRFLDNGYQFVDLSRPFPYNEVIHVDNLSQSVYNQNFVAVKIGDVNNSVQASKGAKGQVRSNTYDFTLDNVYFKQGDQVEIPVSASKAKQIFGFQFEMNFNARTVGNLQINSAALEVNESNYVVGESALRMSWNRAEVLRVEEEEVLFTIVFDALTSGKLSDLLEVDHKAINAEIYDEQFSISNLDIDFRTMEGESFALLQNEPNPFSTDSRISFQLPTAGTVNFKVFDITGKLLMSRSAQYPIGKNTITVNSRDFNTDGVLYYQIEFNGEQLTKKMILVK